MFIRIFLPLKEIVSKSLINEHNYHLSTSANLRSKNPLKDTLGSPLLAQTKIMSFL